MRVILTGVIVVLTSCAANTETPALESRITTWTGSSVHELAGVLGEPTVVTENSWEWRFTGPGMGAATSTSALSHQMNVRNRNSGVDQASPSGLEGKTWTKSADTSISRKECVYRATIDGIIIVGIETLTVSGHCTFGEIPLHASRVR